MEQTEPTESQTQLTFAKHHAFIVGIDEYEKISPLQTAVNDARKLAEVLAMQQHFLVHPPLLNAKGEEIRNLLQKTLRDEVGKDDRVLFYFAGHGIAADGEDGPAGYIVPADADPSDVKTFIPMGDLQRKLDELPCRHLLLILDCCFSGAFKWSSQFRAFGTLMPKKIFKERFDRFVMDPAWQVITSAAYDQKALDVLQGKATGDRGVKKSSDESPHSPFALALFEGLAGEADAKVGQEGDGVITVTELYSYIRDQIEPATIEQSQKLRQTPGFFPLRKHDKGEFIFLHPRHRLNLPPIPKRSPYKGLQSFDESDKELFYGRDRAIKELRAKAETNKLLVVSGASGTGKSSVIKAGLLPLLREEGFYILPVIRPGIHPLAALEKVLQENVASTPDGIAGKADGQKTVLLVDQYEELITRCNNPSESAQFVARLRKLLDESPAETLKIILTVRADFEPQLNDGDLKEYWIAGRCTVPPFSVEELKEVIVMPMIQEVLIFDPTELVDAIIEEVVQSPGALPLLSYTLSELYEAYRTSGRQDRALKREDYDKLGGVMGALRTKADALYKNLDTEAQSTMRKIMLRMVSLEGELAGKRVVMDELKYADPAENQRVQTVIDQLVDARLIVKGKDYIEPAHDALVRAWKTLREWVHTIGEDKIILNTKLNVAANEFAQSQNVKFLWNDNPHLGVLQQELANPRQWFNGKEITFIHKSVQRKKKLSRILRAIATGVVIALSALTVWALFSREQAIHNQKTAESNLLAIRAADVLETDNTKALRLAEAAYAILENDPPVAAQQILSKAFHTLHDKTLFYAVNLQHGDEVTAAAFSPTGDSLLTASWDGTAKIWDIQGNSLKTLDHGSDKITFAAFSPGGKMILTATQEGMLLLWDLDGTPRDTMQHAEEINSAVFSPDEKVLLTACADDTSRLWNLKGELLAKLVHSKQITSAVFNSAGQRILTASADYTAKLWDLQGHLLKTLDKHRRQINKAAFSPDGRLFLTASSDGSAGLWDSLGNFLRFLPHAANNRVNTAEFSPDGKSILTASADYTAKLWDVQGNLLYSLRHGDKVTSAAFSPDGQYIITASADSTARIWDRKGDLLAILKHHNEVKQAVFSPDGRQVLTASKDGTAKLWNLQDVHLMDFNKNGQFAAFSPDSEGIITVWNSGAWLWNYQGDFIDSVELDNQINSTLFSPRDKRILFVLDDGTARLWSSVEKRIVTTLRHGEQKINSAVFSPDGNQILTVTIEKTVRLSELIDTVANERTPQIVGIAGTVNSAVFSPEGDKILTSSNDGYARLWNKNGQLLDSLDHRGKEIAMASFSTMTDHILTVTLDGLTRVWNTKGNLIDSLPTGGVETAVFSPSGESVLIVESEVSPARLWNLRTQRIDSLIHPNNTKVKFAIFAPDGSHILTGAADGVTRLWNLQGEVIAELDNQGDDEVASIAFSPDGKAILTSTMDKHVKLWWTPKAIFDWLKQANICHLTEKEEAEFRITERD